MDRKRGGLRCQQRNSKAESYSCVYYMNGICYSAPDGPELGSVIKNAKRKLETHMESAMP